MYIALHGYNIKKWSLIESWVQVLYACSVLRGNHVIFVFTQKCLIFSVSNHGMVLCNEDPFPVRLEFSFGTSYHGMWQQNIALFHLLVWPLLFRIVPTRLNQPSYNIFCIFFCSLSKFAVVKKTNSFD